MRAQTPFQKPMKLKRQRAKPKSPHPLLSPLRPTLHITTSPPSHRSNYNPANTTLLRLVRRRTLLRQFNSLITLYDTKKKKPKQQQKNNTTLKSTNTTKPTNKKKHPTTPTHKYAKTNPNNQNTIKKTTANKQNQTQNNQNKYHVNKP